MKEIAHLEKFLSDTNIHSCVYLLYLKNLINSIFIIKIHYYFKIFSNLNSTVYDNNKDTLDKNSQI